MKNKDSLWFTIPFNIACFSLNLLTYVFPFWIGMNIFERNPEAFALIIGAFYLAFAGLKMAKVVKAIIKGTLI